MVNISSISKAGSRIYGHRTRWETACAVQETEVAKRFHFQLEANSNGSFTCKRCNYELAFEEVSTVSSERNDQILEENIPKSSQKCTENTYELKRSNTKCLCEKASKQPQVECKVMLERCDNLLIERNLLQSNRTSNEIVILPTSHMDNCATQSLFGSQSTEHNETQSENNPETPSTSGVRSMSSNQQKTSFLNGKGNSRVTRCKLKLRSLEAIKKQKIQNHDSDSKTHLCTTCGRQVCETRWVFHQNKFHPTDDTKKYSKIPSNEKHKTMYLCNHCKYRTFHSSRIRKHVTLLTTESNEAKECEDFKTVYLLDKFNLHRCKMAIAIQKLGLLGLLKD
ncbi:unnamed protein product [Orchesella dallaii]|uniref:C2H2-type domain-containing protein n=1 Tax=Orchesella dallaii TaxID=48710 RepID=A0ABP1QGX2_9HEXA